MRAAIEHEVSHDAKNCHFFTTFSAHTKMAADKRGQIEVFGRIHSILGINSIHSVYKVYTKCVHSVYIVYT